MVLMILLQQEIEMLEDEALHLSDDVWLDAPVPRQADGIEPEFALAVGGADVDMRRLGALVGIEVEPETADAQDRGHDFSVWPGR
jgi:hypothetical protein